MAILRLLASLPVLAGCMAALLLISMLLRFPLLLIAVLLTCWIFSRLLQTNHLTDRVT